MKTRVSDRMPLRHQHGFGGPVSIEEKIADEARFFKTWFDSPGRTGAVSPSGRFLARAMARQIDPRETGLVVELGPGTGPVTEALLDRGVAPERLVLVEYDRPFCRLLQRRFPGTTIVQGDAYRLTESLADVIDGPVSAIVSSLPLLNRPDVERRRLLEQAFEIMGPRGLFVQFTYGITSPIPIRGRATGEAFVGEADRPVWLNLPPARVWRYRRAGVLADTGRAEPTVIPLFEAVARKKQMAPALALLRKIAEGGKSGQRTMRR